MDNDKLTLEMIEKAVRLLREQRIEGPYFLKNVTSKDLDPEVLQYLIDNGILVKVE